MHVSFLTPAAALVALAGVLALAGLLAAEGRVRRACTALGLRPPTLGTSLGVGVALALVTALVALAAAQPVVATTATRSGRADAEVFFVFDVSRSMSARESRSRPTRLDRARHDAKEIQARLPGVPVGVASLTDRLLPHLFPTLSVNAFDATIDRALGIDRPRAQLSWGDSLGTRLGSVGDLGTAAYFSKAAKHRAVVVFTDGETLADEVRRLPTRLAQGNVRAFVFQYWHRDERVYGPTGVNPAYLPNAAAAASLAGIARALRSQIYHEGDAPAAAAAVRAVLGRGPSATRARDLAAVQLAPYLLAAALLPLLFVLYRRNLGRRGAFRAGAVRGTIRA